MTYINTGSTFSHLELKDGHLVINNDRFTFWMSRYNKLGRVHGDFCRIVANGKNKIIIASAL